VRLRNAIVHILTEAIAAGGSTLRDFSSPTGKGYFQFSFSVYDKHNTPCPACTHPINRIVQQGRSTFYCPSCQQEPAA
jgi:formamidopyrimidine-DNA glycosylase